LDAEISADMNGNGDAPKPRIVFIIPHPPAADFARKFFVAELAAAGFEVLLWNAGPLMRLNLSIDEQEAGMPSTRIHSFAGLRANIGRNARSTVFVPQLTRSGRSFVVYAALGLAKVKTAFFARGYLPFISQPKKNRRFFLDRMRRAHNPGLMLRLAWEGFLSRALPVVKAYDVAFTAGRIAERLHGKDARNLVPIHHFDIDQMLADRSAPAVEGPYAVFLDDYLPFHPDFDISNIGHIEAKPYYAALNDYFSWAERTLGLPVVIAAHPKARYPSNPFGEREILFGQTQRLVRDASLVFAHGSTAISFAVMYGKPLCLLASPAIKATHFPEYNQMLKTVDLLGCAMQDIETDRDPKALPQAAAQEKYREFYREFLSNTEDRRPSSAIVVSTMVALSAR
jgi:hypothetical protein